MNTFPDYTPDLGPAGIYILGVLLIIGIMLGLSFILGQRHKGRATEEAYESGIVTTGSARIRFSAKYYLVAMLFVIFDLEVALIFAWAVAARELGWTGYLGIVVFTVILAAGLIYEWKMGALDWIKKTDRSAKKTDEKSEYN
jgi:NADH-quinone oxidoreductase subunit A